MMPAARLLFAALLASAPAPAYAHPHIWITCRLAFRFDASGLEGFTEVWRFDETTSEQILQMFDANGNGRIDRAELPALKAGYFDGLKDYSYFTSIRVDGLGLPTPTPTAFEADYRDSRMVYRFFVPLALPAGQRAREVTVTVWDPTYFTDIDFEPTAAIAIEKNGAIECGASIESDPLDRYRLPPDLYVSQPPPVTLKMAVVRFTTVTRSGLKRRTRRV